MFHRHAFSVFFGLILALHSSQALANSPLKAGAPGPFALGLASYAGGNNFGTPALSAKLEFGTVHSLQFLLGVTNSDPFAFSFGSIYRYNLFGNHNLGFHFGAGFNMGTLGTAAGTTASPTSNPFYMNFLLPVMGMNFNLGGALSNIKLTFDGGAILHVTPSPFQFQMLPLSTMLGGSIHFFF
jgi:hypothetical protein